MAKDPKIEDQEIPKRDFLSFIRHAETNREITLQFLSIKSARTLHRFFRDKGFENITLNDCQQIISSKRHWEQIFSNIRKGKHPCEDINRGY